MDSTIITIFITISSLVLMILIALRSIIRAYPNSALKLEMWGYIILAFSLGWFFFHDDLTNMSTESDLLILNQKIDNLWYFNEDLYEYIDDGNIEEVRERYSLMSQHISQLEESTQTLKKQENTSRFLNGFLFVLSSLLIGCGRGKELILKLDKESKGH